jgi:hypothetical protein
MRPGTKINQSWKRHLPEPSEEPVGNHQRQSTVSPRLHCKDIVSYHRTCPALVRLVSLFVAPTGKHMTDFDAPLSAKVTACLFIMSRTSEVRLAPRERSGPQSGTSALWHPCVPMMVYKPSVAGPACAPVTQFQVSYTPWPVCKVQLAAIQRTIY